MNSEIVGQIETVAARGCVPDFSKYSVAELLAGGVLPDDSDGRGSPLLFSLLDCDDVDIGELRLLLATGADPNITARTPLDPDAFEYGLHVCVAKGHADAADDLIAFGAWVDAVDGTRRTPLWIAVTCFDQLSALIMHRPAGPSVHEAYLSRLRHIIIALIGSGASMKDVSQMRLNRLTSGAVAERIRTEIAKNTASEFDALFGLSE